MFTLLKVLIEREVHALDRPFSYACDCSLKPQKYERIRVKFGNSVTFGLIIEEPEVVECSLEEYNKSNAFDVFMIEELIDHEPIMDDDIFKLATQVSDYYKTPLIGVIKNMLPPTLKPARSSHNKPKEAFVKYIRILKESDDTLSKNEIKCMDKIREKGEVKFTGFGSKITLATLMAKGYVEVYDKKINRIADYYHEDIKSKVLNDEQQKCVDEVLNSKDEVFLLEGVTGSGKTEVFFKLTEEYVSRGKQVLILEPEIALTSRLVTIFKSKFKDRVAVLHSGETPSVLYDEHLRIKRGEVDIVIGARSAVFAPLTNLGLIVIDEEHVASYKQDKEPFYHARTVALLRNKNEKAKILLASATPSLDSKARAQKGVYHQLYLTKRYSDYALPQVEIVDMSLKENIDLDSVIISKVLREGITEVLKNGKQALLFINRRGYAPVYSCRKCGKIFKCPNCDVPLTYHKEDNTIKCHHCDYEVSASSIKCPSCGGEVFGKTGFGTERIVDEIKRLFPTARVCRIDRDIASKKKDFALTMQAFKEHEYDIMIGTQMIAKGHDFKDVELSCALMADKSLTIPSYTANEETFDILTQLIGRSGRFSGKGKAIIQTYMPDNEVIKLACKQDYDDFYKFEMHNRKVFLYPPYIYLAVITISGNDSKELEQFGFKIKNYLAMKLKDAQANIYGPSLPYLKKVNNRYYRKIMIKYKSRLEVEDAFKDLFNLEGRSLKITLDIDPVGDC